jgi:hypothetical protein
MIQGEIILYNTEDGQARIRLHAGDGTVWLSQAEMAELFQTTKQNVSLHIQNVLSEGELAEEATVKESLTVQVEGDRQVERSITLYRLEMILNMGLTSWQGSRVRKTDIVIARPTGSRQSILPVWIASLVLAMTPRNWLTPHPTAGSRRPVRSAHSAAG